MTKVRKQLREFVFRGLLFESEAEPFKRAGIAVGVDLQLSEAQLLDEALAPFGVARRNDALQMSRLYAVLHCFENELRSFIRETLEEDAGPDWWTNKDVVPESVKKVADSRQKTALKDSWLEGDKVDLLSFVEFGDLARIIIHNWDKFKDLVPSQEWLKQRMLELEKARNFIAHNRMLLSSEFQRIYMYVSDWNKLIGL